MNVGDLVALKEDKKPFYEFIDRNGLGTGIVISEFVNASGDLFFEVFWSTGIKEYIRPSWLKLIKRSVKK